MAATITKGYTFGASELVTNTKLHTLVDSATISGIVSAEIADGTIVNADINASAAIVGSKLDLSAPGAIGGTTPAAITGTVVEAGTSLAITGTGDDGVVATGIKDEDAMGSDSATHLATQQSIKAYVDANGSVAGSSGFLVNPSTDQSNISNASEVTIVLGTERFDIGNDFASNTFTAPATGKYLFSGYVVLADADSAADYYYLKLKTSNLEYAHYFDTTTLAADATHLPMWISLIVDMDASDTCSFVIRQLNGTSGQTDLGATTTYFSGCRLA